MFKHPLLLTVITIPLFGAPTHAQDVKVWITKLESGNDADKLAAAVALAELGSHAEPAAPALAAALQAKNEDLRLNSALALGKIGAPAVKPVAKVLDSANASDRFYAVWTLGMIGPPAKETAPEIVKLLADKDNHVRRKAAFALGRIAPEPKIAIGPLVRLLADPIPDVRQSASDALGKFGIEAVPALIAALKDETPANRREAARALGHIGGDAKEAIPHLKNLFLTGEPAAADALGEIGKASIPALADCIKHDKSDIRVRALQTLGKIGADAVPTLVDALGDKNVDVRLNAAAMLAPLRVNDKLVVLALAHGIHDSDQGVRRQCLQGLQNLGAGAKLAAPKLIAALKDSDGPNRLQILVVLQNIGAADKEILPIAAGLLGDGSVQVRRTAVNLLGAQGGQAAPHLIVALKDADLSVRLAATRFLKSIGTEAKQAAPALSDMVLQDANAAARRTAVLAIAAIEPEKLDDLFAKVKKHNDDKVRLSAYQGLYYRVGKKGTVTALPAKAALPHLIDATKDAAASIRILAAQGLGNLGPDAKDAIPALTALAQDVDVNVRNAAAQALAQIQGKS